MVLCLFKAFRASIRVCESGHPPASVIVRLPVKCGGKWSETWLAELDFSCLRQIRRCSIHVFILKVLMLRMSVLVDLVTIWLLNCWIHRKLHVTTTEGKELFGYFNCFWNTPPPAAWQWNWETTFVIFHHNRVHFTQPLVRSTKVRK